MLINSYAFAAASTYDTDAQAYITAVEAADTAAEVSGGLETATKDAINAFVVGCKLDGTWIAIKACCILAGARTLAGALVPLVGTAPTNNNFVSGDYNRKTGVLGNGTNKYLNSNRNNNADPQNSKHLSGYLTTAVTGGVMGTPDYTQAGWSGIYLDNVTAPYYFNPGINNLAGQFANNQAGITLAGFNGASRNSSTNVTTRRNGASSDNNKTSAAPLNSNILVFGGIVVNAYSSQRIAFYSIGESLNLSLLDARVTALISAISAAF